MYLAIPSQTDCISAWLEATKEVNDQPEHEAHNVILDVRDPTARASLADPAVRVVNDFLVARKQKSVETVAKTIFPARAYDIPPEFYYELGDRILNRFVRGEPQWSGYYFERMMRWRQADGGHHNQLRNIIERIRAPNVRTRNKFELSIFDPNRDANRSPYGGQCLSFASFKIIGKRQHRKLALTAMYRNHYYIEKLLGNLIGLGRLLGFVSTATGIAVGPLTIVSTHATIDTPINKNTGVGTTRGDITNLLTEVERANHQLGAGQHP